MIDDHDVAIDLLGKCKGHTEDEYLTYGGKKWLAKEIAVLVYEILKVIALKMCCFEASLIGVSSRFSASPSCLSSSSLDPSRCSSSCLCARRSG